VVHAVDDLAGAVFGGLVSILSVWLTQRYNLRAQLMVKSAEADKRRETASRSEKEKRYLSIVQNIEALYEGTGDPAKRAAFLRATREVWLLGDAELIRKLKFFLFDISDKSSADPIAQLFGDIILEMRRGLNLPTDDLSNVDFPFHGPGAA
jgi:hypothetical protein